MKIIDCRTAEEKQIHAERQRRIFEQEDRTWSRRGRLVMSLPALANLARLNKSVVVNGWKRQAPARWVMCMQASQVHKMLSSHRIYTYTAKGGRK